MSDVFYKIRRKGTTDQFSTGGENPFWSPVGKTWNKLAHLNCHVQQVRQRDPSSRRAYGSYQYRHSNMEPANYRDAEVVTFEAVVVEVQDAASFLQGAQDRRAERLRKKRGDR